MFGVWESVGRCGGVCSGVGKVRKDVGKCVKGGTEMLGRCGECEEMWRKVWGSVLGCGVSEQRWQ